MSQPRKTDPPPPQNPEDALKKSLALPFDPKGDALTSEKALTAPLKPLQEEVAFAPLWMGIIALMLLGGLIGVVFLSTTTTSQVGEFPATSSNAVCEVQALNTVDVRAGAGLDYAVEWILSAQERRQVLAIWNADWLQLANGWIPKSAVEPNTTSACSQLSQPEAMPIFTDDLALPDEVVALGWEDTFDENFATDERGWLSEAAAGNAVIREGQLVLFAELDNPTPPIFPRQIASQDFEDAFFIWSGQWIASDLAAEAIFTFRRTAAGYYELKVRRDGLLTLQRIMATGQGQVIEQMTDSVLREDQFELGVLVQGQQVRVYLNNDLLFRSIDENLSAGTYTFGLAGDNASFSIRRFEVKTPPKSQ